MVYVVERYLPGLSRADLLPRLSRLEPVIDELRGEGSVVRYLGSAIVLEDEACFCHFESPSATAVAEANRRADLPFDRIVPAVLVQPTQRSAEMSISTSIPKPAGLRHSPHLAAIAAVIAVIALATAARTATRALDSGTRPAHASGPTQKSALRSLTPQERQYVLGILSLTPAQLQAAFGTGPTSVPDAGNHTGSTVTTSPSVALPILPACGPGPCWRGATGTARPVQGKR
jgi:hypothetical protein